MSTKRKEKKLAPVTFMVKLDGGAAREICQIASDMGWPIGRLIELELLNSLQARREVAKGLRRKSLGVA